MLKVKIFSGSMRAATVSSASSQVSNSGGGPHVLACVALGCPGVAQAGARELDAGRARSWRAPRARG